ncbi:MAG: response regulator [Pseudomonadota bacterium]
MKVLLVDDEVEFVSTLAERLSFRGIDADWVSAPEDAVTKATEGCYDLAVLDVKMPRIGGIELKRRLQQTCPSMKFIFLTGHGSQDAYMTGAAEAGSDYYLLKPLRLEDLLAKISVIQAKIKEVN